MKKSFYVFSSLFLSTLLLASCGEPLSSSSTSSDVSSLPTTTYVELGEIVASTTTLHARQSITLSLENDEEVSWSVSDETLATIDENGVLSAKEKSGSFFVTATSVRNPQYQVNKLFNVNVLEARDLTSMLYSLGSNYNYTITWTGDFLSEDGEALTRNEIAQVTNSDEYSLSLYDDFAVNGNIAKFTDEAYYYRYGEDSNGNLYEGGSYNSPDGYVYDYDVNSNGEVVKGAMDYYSGFLGISDYKEIYTSDLSYFVRDEFKVEDSHLTLSEDGAYLEYNAGADENEITNFGPDVYAPDYSLPIAIFIAVDPGYGSSLFNAGYHLAVTGKMQFDDEHFYGEFIFPDIYMTDEFQPDYVARFTIDNIGTTVIPGIMEQIALDEAALGN